MVGSEYDVAIIGGGINGCGIARDAAGRGLSVFLAEKDDLANGTSSASTKLVHGGLRYLEHYEFGLVRKSLREREVLWKMAPHIIYPLRFVLPHRKGLRPVWMIRLGLFLYDHLGSRKHLQGSRFIDLTHGTLGEPLSSSFTKGFEYSDCWVDDSRLVILNARDAANRGADICTRTELTAAKRQGNSWNLELKDKRSGANKQIRARVLVNATGPWIDDVIETQISLPSKSRIRLVKGSHIVVPRIFNHNHAYIFQNLDRRIIFVIPYEQDFTLIGTTDQDFSGRLEDAAAEASEISYLCSIVSEYFKVPIKPQDVVWSFAGVRPLYDDGASAAQEATRDYVLELDGNRDCATVIHVFGGKITTYRNLAEEVLSEIKPWLASMGPPWTRGVSLPGGDFPIDGISSMMLELGEQYPLMDKPFLKRLVYTYGTLSSMLLDKAKTKNDLGHYFGGTLYQREVEYLINMEWALTADDILWRRTKQGLALSDNEITGLSSWLTDSHINIVT